MVCARGDFEQDSDIDIMVLLDSPAEKMNEERKKILDASVVAGNIFNLYNKNSMQPMKTELTGNKSRARLTLAKYMLERKI